MSFLLFNTHYNQLVIYSDLAILNFFFSNKFCFTLLFKTQRCKMCLNVGVISFLKCQPKFLPVINKISPVKEIWDVVFLAW